MDVDGLCDIYSNMRDFMKKNEIQSSRVSESEAIQRIEKTLAIKIPGGALPCPLLTYPPDGATDDAWFSFLQSVPIDFGSRVVFMILYAKKELKRRADNINAALNGEKTMTDEEFEKMDKDIEKAGGNIYESFTGLFPPTVADTRSMEKFMNPLRSLEEGFEEDKETPEEKLQRQVTTLLNTLTKTRNDTLRAKGISPTIDLAPYLSSAKESMKFIIDKQKKLNDGSIVNDVNLPSTA
jgi:hypothetical protein